MTQNEENWIIVSLWNLPCGAACGEVQGQDGIAGQQKHLSFAHLAGQGIKH
jgi:hypothetical protein